MVDIAVEVGSLRLGSPEPSVELQQTPPLFVVGKGSTSANDVLLHELRLSQMRQENDARYIVQRALVDARMRFFRRLGPNRVSYLSAIPHTYNPITQNQTLRVLAASTEILIVRQQLLRKLPFSAIDGGSVNDEWNDTGFAREAAERELEREITRLDNEISENMELLAGEETIGHEAEGMQISTLGPRTRPPLPGSTVWPYLR